MFYVITTFLDLLIAFIFFSLLYKCVQRIICLEESISDLWKCIEKQQKMIVALNELDNARGQQIKLFIEMIERSRKENEVS